MNESSGIPAQILHNLDHAVVGKREIKRLLLIGMMAGGHVLIEGGPGTGKTTTARAFCQALGGVFKRLQFTPDMLPSDITGFYVYRTDGVSRFIEGPIFANVVLADELNRATPRTQAALLEAMQERQVTVEGATHPLPQPMMVIGSQLPYGGPGTYPLASVQADRFMLHGWSDMPTAAEELEIVSAIDRIEAEVVQPSVGPDQILGLRREVAQVHVAEPVLHYILALVAAIRGHAALAQPVSPRVGISLYKCSRAAAFLAGRDFVVPDDVKGLLGNVVHHRLVLKPEAESDGRAREAVIHAALGTVAVPKGVDNSPGSE